MNSVNLSRRRHDDKWPKRTVPQMPKSIAVDKLMAAMTDGYIEPSADDFR